MQQPTVCPLGSRALGSQTWLRKIDARSCVEWLITEYIDATSCADFVKPCLASQSFWARRTNWIVALLVGALQLASQNKASNSVDLYLRWMNSYMSTLLFASFWDVIMKGTKQQWLTFSGIWPDGVYPKQQRRRVFIHHHSNNNNNLTLLQI